MITLYSGTPGSGKSLHVAKYIRERLQTRGTVTIGNFYINVKSVKRRRGTYLCVSNHRLTPARLITFARRLSAHYGRRLREGEVVIVLDEAQLLFNSREWQNMGRAGWLSFFTQHRHFGYDVILIAQFDRMLDRQIRSLIEYDVVHRRISRAGWFGAVLGFLTRGCLFAAVRRWYPVKQYLDMSFFWGGKRIYEIYDSYNCFDGPALKGGG